MQLSLGRNTGHGDDSQCIAMTITRRFLLQAGVAGASSLGALARGTGKRRPSVQRVVVVALAGGVRTKETFGSPGNIPNLMRMAEAGVVYTRVKASNLGHYGATLSMFTGISEGRGIRDNTRGGDPTMFEYLRKHLNLSASDVWISTSGGTQEANIAYGLHKDYGEEHGASTLDGDGIFNASFRALLQDYGRPRTLDEAERDILKQLRIAMERSQSQEARLTGLGMEPKVENFLIDELGRGTADLSGVGASDAKAFRVARNLLAAFRPKVLAVVARDADVAHGNFNDYVQVIRRNDAALGELWEAIQEDPVLAESTAMLVLPEFGRDVDLNSRRGLDHGDNSESLNYVSLVCCGPGIRRGLVVKEDVRTIDLCPTVCALFDVTARYARGEVLPKLFS